MSLSNNIDNDGVDNNMDASDSSSTTWRKRLFWELRPSYGLFSLEEYHPNGQQCIDVAASFASRRWPFLSIPIRLLLLLWSMQVFYEDVTTYPPHNYYIYMGYLTHWGHTLCILYFVGSFHCAILPLRQPPPGEPPRFIVKMTWGLYDTVAPLEIAICILYWSGTSGPQNYISIMEHGVLAMFVLLDGLVIGRIPVRAKHGIFLMTTCLCYLLWTIVNAALDIGGGEWGPAFDDDALYPVLRWRSETTAAAIVSAFATCVLAPALFVACWMMSLASKSTTGCCCCCCVLDGSRRLLYQERQGQVDIDGRGVALDTAFGYEAHLV